MEWRVDQCYNIADLQSTLNRLSKDAYKIFNIMMADNRHGRDFIFIVVSCKTNVQLENAI